MNNIANITSSTSHTLWMEEHISKYMSQLFNCWIDVLVISHWNPADLLPIRLRVKFSGNLWKINCQEVTWCTVLFAPWKENWLYKRNSISYLGERPTNAVSCGLITSRRWALFRDRLVMHIPNNQEESSEKRKKILIKQRQLCSRGTLQQPSLKSSYQNMNSWQDILISILMTWKTK